MGTETKHATHWSTKIITTGKGYQKGQIYRKMLLNLGDETVDYLILN